MSWTVCTIHINKINMQNIHTHMTAQINANIKIYSFFLQM